jgi:hypothetical protein
MATPAWTPNDAPAVVEAKEAEAAAWQGTASQPAIPTLPPSAPARKPTVDRPEEQAREPREPRERPAWLIPAAIAVVVLLLLGIVGGIFLATRGGTPGGVATKSPSPRATASPRVSPTPTSTGGPLAVPTYAPAAAAPITNVAFCIQATHPCGSNVAAADYTNCKLTGPCKVMVEIKFSTVQNSKVAYILKFFDRCTGVTTNLPGPSFVPTGFNRVDLQKQVILPAGAKSAALVAVTTNPTAAASAPLLLGSETC